MAERNTAFAVGASTGTAATSILALYGSADADSSLSSLPTVPQVGARTIRIRGTVLVTAAGTAAGGATVTVRQGQGAAGAVVGQPTVTAAATPAVGTAIPFEVIDAAPALPALNYSVVISGYTVAGTVNVTAEIEEVN